MAEFFGAMLLALGATLLFSIVTRSVSRVAEINRARRLNGIERRDRP